MSYIRNLLFWVLLAALLVLLFNFFVVKPGDKKIEKINFTSFLTQVEEGHVKDVVITGADVKGHLKDGTSFQTYVLAKPNLVEDMYKKGVAMNVKPVNNESSSIIGGLISWLPMLLFIGIWIFYMRQMQSGGGRGGVMGFGRSRARLLNDKRSKVTFNDVAGIDEAKDDLQEVVEFLKEPERFQKLGGKIPKGVLLIGPPGTGKTLLARAIAGEASVPFFSISGSDFVEMFVGVGASRVRDMFEQAKKNAPCIVFVDEIDAVGRHRGAGLGGGNDEREQTLNQLLVEMDGFEANEGIIIVAATNRPDVLDPALLRPGRFDRQIIVPNPDVGGREKILKVHAKKIPLAPDARLDIIARGTPGFSGADLANLVNEAALLAAKRNRKLVTHKEFEDAKDKVMMGGERRSLAMKDEEKKLTAYHEGGHALVALNNPASDPIHKATIIPRGRALGMVMRLPESDALSMTREKMNADIAVAMGGRVAEEVIFGYDKVTSGASSDIQMATRLAKAMVTRFGMSDKLGPILYDNNEEEVFLGHSVARSQNISEDTQNLIDQETKAIVEKGYKNAKHIIENQIDKLHILAKGLLEYETLTGNEIKDLIAGKSPQRLLQDEGLHGSSKGEMTSSAFPVTDSGPDEISPSQPSSRPKPKTSQSKSLPSGGKKAVSRSTTRSNKKKSITPKRDTPSDDATT